MSYKHLNKSTIPYVDKPLKEKIRWVRAEHFVYYKKAQKCLEQLKWIFEQSQYHEDDGLPYDLEGLTIIGNSGAGKTYIVKEFMRLHSSEHHPTYEGYPVGYCMLKDSVTGLKGLYSALLSAYGHPYGDSGILKLKKITIDQLEETLLHVLKETQTRLLFIDEFQHAMGRNQQAILNQLKRTMLVSHVPFVPVGVPLVSDILQLDSQLADRCPVTEYSKLNYWKLNPQFKAFLKAYESFLPFSEPSNLSSGDFSQKIFERVRIPSKKNDWLTNLRRVVRYLKRVAVRALKEDHKQILEEDINAIQY
jgi:hypothetical protein